MMIVIAASVKWLWVCCCIVVLLTSLYFYDGRPNSDADILLGYGMLVLTFPIGLILTTFVGVLGYLLYIFFGYVFTTTYWSMILTWVVLFIVGYWQWFKLSPWIIQRLKWPLSNGR
jgi:hypothetical protein